MKEIILPEITETGVFDSQFINKNNIVTKNRKVNEFEIELPLEKGGISYLGSEQIPIDTNIVICAKPGDIRHTKFPFKCDFLHINLYDGELYDILINAPSFILTNKFHVYHDIFKKLRKHFNAGPEDKKIILYSLILELIYELESDLEKQSYIEKLKNDKYIFIEKAIEYIKENINSDLTLKTVAEYSSFSPIYFHNCFKLVTGKTLHEYIEEQRIRKATDLLLTTNLKLSEIAYECGFSSQSYFNYAFKRKMKLTPREYAKEQYKRYNI